MEPEDIPSWLDHHTTEEALVVSSRALLRNALAINVISDNQLPELILPYLRTLFSMTVVASGFSPDFSVVQGPLFRASEALGRLAKLHPGRLTATNSRNYGAFTINIDFLGSIGSLLSKGFSEQLSNTIIGSIYGYGVEKSSKRYLNSMSDMSDISIGSLMILERPLWSDADRELSIDESIQKLDYFFDQDPVVWGFWKRWYHRFLDGGSRDWELYREVALIPDEDWDQGAEHVAQIIGRIEARRLQDEAAIAEVVWFDEDAGRFDVRPIEMPREDIVRLALERVKDSFSDALKLGRGQHIKEESVEAFVLNRVFQKYRSDPQRIEMDFTDVAKLLRQQITSGEYPDSPDLRQLASALVIACTEIRATYPEVRETRDRLDRQAPLEPLGQAQQEQLAEALPVLQAISTERLGEGLEEDIRELVNGALLPIPAQAPLVPPIDVGVKQLRKSVGRRLAYRVSSIARNLSSLDLSGLVHRIDGSAGYKGIKIVGTIMSLLGPLLFWFI